MYNQPIHMSFGTHPPFEPTIKNEKIYARGACDDKGQMYMHLKAYETLKKVENINFNINL